MRRKVTSQTHKNIIQNNILRKIRAYRIGDRAQAGTALRDSWRGAWSISNRRSRSSRNITQVIEVHGWEHIESEIALKPEHDGRRIPGKYRAYRIGDRAQAGTMSRSILSALLSISNRRSRSSRNEPEVTDAAESEHIESEIALKPEQRGLRADAGHGAYRIGDRAQAGTKLLQLLKLEMSISNRRSRSSRNVIRAIASSGHEHIESEIALKPER